MHLAFAGEYGWKPPDGCTLFLTGNDQEKKGERYTVVHNDGDDTTTVGRGELAMNSV